MICFQFFEQLIFTTAVWLHYHLQQSCCDLLSVLWTIDIYNSCDQQSSLLSWVVICFQFFEQLIFTTAYVLGSPSFHWSCDLLSVLWTTDIYNSVWTNNQTQVPVVICFQFFEQLIFTTASCRAQIALHSVVICFQFFEQLIFTTADQLEYYTPVLLWFAFSSLKTDIYNS